MLSLQVRSGEYIAIGDDIIVQIFRDGPVSRVAVKAPKELQILRGEVLERSEGRPDGLRTKRPKSSSDRRASAKRLEEWSAKKEQRQRQEAEQAAVVQELMSITDNIHQLAATPELQEQLRQLRNRLSELAAQQAE